MFWPIIALTGAFFESLKDVFSKKNLRQIDEYTVALVLRLSFIFLLPILFFTKIPEIGDKFLISLLFSGTINAATTILYMKALKYSDISISVPLLSFTPMFLLLTSPIIVGEFPTPLGLCGIFAVVFGAYFLNIKQRHGGFLAPFKALLKEKGPRYMLVIAFLWSITSNVDKIGILNSSPLFWTITVNNFISACLLPIVIFRKKQNFGVITKNLHWLMPIALFSAISLFAQMTAISLTLVSYVISIKRSSVAISVLMGYLFFKEKNVKERLIGAIIMLAGVLLITLS